jgi:hypothetical protein
MSPEEVSKIARLIPVRLDTLSGGRRFIVVGSCGKVVKKADETNLIASSDNIV